MSMDTSIPTFTGNFTRLTDTPLVAADMFAPAALAGLETDALANINGPSVLCMPDLAAGKQAASHMKERAFDDEYQSAAALTT
jgi:hypothetical protein